MKREEVFDFIIFFVWKNQTSWPSSFLARQSVLVFSFLAPLFRFSLASSVALLSLVTSTPTPPHTMASQMLFASSSRVAAASASASSAPRAFAR